MLLMDGISVPQESKVREKVSQVLGKVQIACSVCHMEFMECGPEIPGGGWIMIGKENLYHNWKKGVGILCLVVPYT